MWSNQSVRNSPGVERGYPKAEVASAERIQGQHSGVWRLPRPVQGGGRRTRKEREWGKEGPRDALRSFVSWRVSAPMARKTQFMPYLQTWASNRWRWLWIKKAIKKQQVEQHSNSPATALNQNTEATADCWKRGWPWRRKPSRSEMKRVALVININYFSFTLFKL